MDNKKAPVAQSSNRGFLMVGVARIELATPAMSTQGLRRKREFSVHYRGRRYGTCIEQIGKRRKFHRNYTGAAFRIGLKSKAPDPVAAGSSANIAYHWNGRVDHITTPRQRIAGTLTLWGRA